MSYLDYRMKFLNGKYGVGRGIATYYGLDKSVFDTLQTAQDIVDNATAMSLIESLNTSDWGRNELWSFTFGNDVYGVAVDSAGNVYGGSADNTLRKFDSDGNELWSFTFGDNVVAVAVDSAGNVYGGSSDNTLRKFSQSLYEILQIIAD